MSKNLSNQQADEDVTEAFAVFDKNGDGEISSQELSMVFQTLGENFSVSEVANMISRVDKDGSGTVNFEEFVDMMRR